MTHISKLHHAGNCEDYSKAFTRGQMSRLPSLFSPFFWMLPENIHVVTYELIEGLTLQKKVTMIIYMKLIVYQELKMRQALPTNLQ